MKKTLFLLILSILTLDVFAQNIIPKHVKIKNITGAFNITATTTIGANTAESQKIAEMFATKLKQSSGITPKIQKNGAIQFTINPTPNTTIGNEGYTLEANNAGIKIAANKP